MESVRSLFSDSPSLQKLTLFVSLAAIFLVSMSFLVSGKAADTFWPLFFLYPVLWVLWLGCACFVTMERRISRLAFLWILIDLGILGLFVSCSTSDAYWIKSQGVEMVLVLAFLPIVFPSIFIVAALPNGISLDPAHYFDGLKGIVGDRLGEVVLIWLDFSLIGAIQSIIICVVAACFLGKIKEHKRPPA